MSKMIIAVLGHGTVGRSLAALLDAREDIELRYILELPEKCSESRMVSDLDVILEDREVQLVADALPAVHPSYEFIRRSLEAGKHVVTSNKAALCFGYRELTELAESRGLLLGYEASCGGTIPCIAEAVSLSESNTLTACCGIMNGTSNYILDAMLRKGSGFEETLQKARELGYAEADPSADLSGYDVKNKIVILSSTAYRGFVQAEFPFRGIIGITAEILSGLRQEGRTVKLLGLSVREGNRYALGVTPVILPLTSLEASVPENFNLFTLEGSSAGTVKLYGQGAGGIPTADAMLRDILKIREKAGRTAGKYYVNELVYAPELLTGTGRIGAEQVRGTLEELSEKADRQGGFFAFEPDFMKF